MDGSNAATEAMSGDSLERRTKEDLEKLPVEGTATANNLCVQESGENVTETATAADANAEATEETVAEEVVSEQVAFKVMFKKEKLDITFNFDDTVTSLKKYLETRTAVPESMQKLMFRGKMTDSQTLRDHGLTNGSKVMMIGSTVSDILTVTPPNATELKQEVAKQQAAKEPMCQQKPHKTILEKHRKPDDAMMGVKNKKERLPHVPVSGMYNKSGGKVRLTFKLEQDELWIGTKERTDKIPMNTIKNVVSEAIKDHEEYHMMGIQLGPTEASRYWIYWVPAQYVDAIKDTLLGKWQNF